MGVNLELIFYPLAKRLKGIPIIFIIENCHLHFWGIKPLIEPFLEMVGKRSTTHLLKVG
jgi:hypothetical protein